MSIKSFYEKHRYFVIFAVAFTFYLCFSFCLARNYVVKTNAYFGADPVRTHRDLLVIANITHFRVKVHPLFLMLLQPIALLINGIVNHGPTTEALMGATIGGISTMTIYHIADRYVKKESTKLLLASMFAATFSIMFFATVPDSFLFSGTFLVLFWDYILYKIQKKEAIEKLDYVMLIFFGIVCFGITLTNYMSYTFGFMALLLICVDNWKDRIKKFFSVNVINGVIILTAAKIQQLAWKGDVPLFWEYLLSWKTTPENYEETDFMYFSLSIVHVMEEFYLSLVHGFFGGLLEIRDDPTSDSWTVWFAFGHHIVGVITALTLLILFIVFLSFVFCIWKKKHVPETLCMVLVLASNLGLHYIYGPNESFIYTPHYFFGFFVLLALGLGVWEEHKLPVYVLTGWFAAELVLNIVSYRQMIYLVADAMGEPMINLPLTVLCTIAFCVVFFTAIFFLRKALATVLTIKETGYREKASVAIACYAALITATVFFVNYYTNHL